jgi:hypothetical protein
MRAMQAPPLSYKQSFCYCSRQRSLNREDHAMTRRPCERPRANFRAQNVQKYDTAPERGLNASGMETAF